MSKSPVSVQKAWEMSTEEKEQLLRKIEQDAYDNEVLYWGCSQAVLGALQRHLNLGNNEVFRAASAFAGGVGMMREACGALLGGVMAISSAYGRANFEAGKVGKEQPAFLEAAARANKFGERFKEKFGSLRCADIKAAVRGTEYDVVNTIESFEAHKKCGDVTGPAARLAAEIILQPTELFADGIKARLEEIAQVRKLQKRRVRPK